VFFKFKKNLDKNDFESEVVFLKDDFHGKIVFQKDNFESVHFSNKLQKSLVWSKNIKNAFFSKFGQHISCNDLIYNLCNAPIIIRQLIKNICDVLNPTNMSDIESDFLYYWNIVKIVY
jgi:hypothetical protein